MSHPHDLQSALERFRYVRLSRGAGAHYLQSLLRRLHAGEVEIDEETERALTEVLASVGYAIEDLDAEARNNLRVTSRTIGAAIRRGGR